MKKYISYFLAALLVAQIAQAQKTDAEVYKGNELYRKQQYDKAIEEYQLALAKDPKNPVANYNTGNASFRQNKYDESVKAFDNTINAISDKNIQQQSYYNKGVALIRQQKLQESIEAWKQALKLNPQDLQTRENLEKALRELRKKQQEEKQQKKDKKEQKEKEQPQKPQSKLSQQRVEQLLKALQQKEKEVNTRFNQNKVAAPSKPEKDW